jgi:hypothetical protein
MHRTVPAVSFLSVGRGAVPARPLIGITLFGGRNVARYAVNAPDVVSAAERIAAATNEQFERRTSDHWGEYCLFHALLNATDLRVFSNADPMYRPHLDPPEDRVFESQFGAEQVLVDDEREGGERIEALIRDVFPSAIRLGGAAAE